MSGTLPSLRNPRWLIRIAVVAAGLAVCDWSEIVVGERGFPAGGIGDGMFALFTPLNALLLAHPAWANAVLITTGLIIDITGVSLIAWAVFGPSIRPFFGLLIVYTLRQTCEALVALPPPTGMIWRYPGFPSLLVRYDVANDFFFSGHMATTVFGAAELAALGRRSLTALGVAASIFMAAALFSLRAHYTMDVFAGTAAAIMTFLAADRIADFFHRAVDRLFKEAL